MPAFSLIDCRFSTLFVSSSKPWRCMCSTQAPQHPQEGLLCTIPFGTGLAFLATGDSSRADAGGFAATASELTSAAHEAAKTCRTFIFSPNVRGCPIVDLEQRVARAGKPLRPSHVRM